MKSSGGLSAAARKALARRLAPLAKIARGLDKDILGYVTKGENAKALARIRRSKNSGLLLCYGSDQGICNRKSEAAEETVCRDLKTFYDLCAGAGPELLLRYAEVVAAAGQASGFDADQDEEDGPDWLPFFAEDLLRSLFGESPHSEQGALPKPITAQLIAAMLELDGNDPDLLPGFFFAHFGDSWECNTQVVLATLPGMTAFLHGRPEALRALPDRLQDENDRLKLANALVDLDLVPDPYIGVLLALAMDRKKLVWEPVEELLSGFKAQAKAPLLELLGSGSAERRFRAVRLLSRFYGAEVAEALTARLEIEKSKKVVEAIEAALAAAALTDDGAAEAGGAEGGTLAASMIPDYQRPELDGRLGKDWTARLDEAIGACKTALARQDKKRARDLGLTDAVALTALIDGKRPSDADSEGHRRAVTRLLEEPPAAELLKLFDHPDFKLIHLVRLILLDYRADWRLKGFWDPDVRIDGGGSLYEIGDLRVLADVLEHAGSDPDRIGHSLLQESYWEPEIALPPDAVWPYFAERSALIACGLGLQSAGQDLRFDRIRTLQYLTLFPAPPAALVLPLFDFAFGPTKTLRPLARACLAGVPGKEERILLGLSSAKQEVRELAAEWLAEIGHRPAVPAIEAALDTETQAVTKAVFLAVLESLGGDLDAFLGPARLLQEAEAALEKGPPKGLAAWFPFEALPRLRWRADGRPVDPKIVTWWLAIACQLKRPGGTPLLERYLGLLKPEDAAALGRFVLQAFMAHDARRPSLDEANAYAEAYVESSYRSWKKWSPGITEEQVFNTLKREKLSEYFGSAIKEKGILALATRVPGRDAVPLLQAFMRDHYLRRAQIEALLETLVPANDMAGTQLLLATAQRYRNKAVQDKARDLATRIAELNGWTPDQLADRTIPAAGLDDSGELELDCGTRRFTARLDETLTLSLVNPDGKVVKALPAPRKGEDPGPIKAAKKQLAEARKELKTVVTLQTQRLHEALCTGRRWPAEDWRRYLLAHPIVGRLCQRLVWLAMAEDRLLSVFRPLEDGSLSDSQDRAIELPQDAEVLLAHSALLPEGDAAAWRRHLADYEVVTLFPQLAETHVSPTPEQLEATRIDDRRGYLLDAFTLRGKAGKLGYKRGEVMDAGYFDVYELAFPGLGIHVSLAFSGNFVPEENVPVALTELTFLKTGKNRYASKPLPLKEVPPVLLSEAWGHYHSIAEAGSGFDPEWETKVQCW